MDFGADVHISLLGSDLLFGLPKMLFFGLLLFTAFFCFYITPYFAIPMFVLFMICRLVTKKDTYMLSIMWNDMMSKGRYEV